VLLYIIADHYKGYSQVGSCFCYPNTEERISQLNTPEKEIVTVLHSFGRFRFLLVG